MKKLIIFLLPVFIITGLINTVLNPSKNNLVYAQDYPDESVPEGDNLPTPSGGILGGMFNERGFYTSNSASYDENQIINDFNGNLMYSIPLYNFKGEGDLNINMSLNYNGSVAHTALVATPQFSRAGGNLPQVNYNIPLWMVNLNGWAVQTTNFETNYLTSPSGSAPPYTATTNQVRLLTSGYHLTHRLVKVHAETGPDVITLLRGDGSLLTLENIDTLTTNDSITKYIGTYYSSNRNDYTIAYVKYKNGFDSLNPFVSTREMLVMPGDGLTYKFEEFFVNYYDVQGGDSYATVNVPKCFYLTKILDRYGNEMEVHYLHPGYNPEGRLNFSFIYTPFGDQYNIDLDYTQGSTGWKFAFKNTVRGNYNVFIDPTSLTHTDKHLTYINSIVSPENRTMSFSYQSIGRIVSNARYNMENNAALLNITNTGSQLKRMSQCINYNGGKRTYNYVGEQELTVNLEGMNADPPDYAVASNTSFFLGQGRDPFYTNMVDTIWYYDKNFSNHYKKEIFEYDWVRATSTLYKDDPVDETDIYTSKKIISPNSTYSNLNASIQAFSSTKTYTNYQLFDQYSGPLLGNSDWPGEVKLESDEIHYSANNTTYRSKITTYQFDKGAESSFPSGNVYSGSFLDTAITETFDTYNSGTTSSKTTISYVHSTYPTLFTNNYRKPVVKTVQTDNFELSTTTDYKLYTGKTRFYSDGKFSGDTNKGTADFYLINVPYRIEKHSPGTPKVLRERTDMFYVDNENSSVGYVGQLLTTRFYSIPDTIHYKDITNEYYKSDTTGVHLYGGYYLKPGVEGNLKAIIDANNNRTQHYYNPISAHEGMVYNQTPVEDDYEGEFTQTMSENPLLIPRVAFNKVYYNGNVVGSSMWQDSRLPSRTDVYSSSNSFLTTYSNYDEAGNLIRSIDNNKYLSVMAYEKAYRLMSGTLPYDFNNDVSYKDTLRDTIISPFVEFVQPNGFGYKNMLSSANNSDRFTYNAQNLICPPDGNKACDIIIMDVNKNTEESDFPEEAEAYPFFSLYDKANLQPGLVYEIDSAFIGYNPSYFSHEINNDTTSSLYSLKMTTLENITYTDSDPMSNAYNYIGKITYIPTASSNLGSVNALLTQALTNCTNSPNAYNSSYNRDDITSLLTNHLLTQNKPLKGFYLSVVPTASNFIGTIEAKTSFSQCVKLTTNASGGGILHSAWYNNYCPRIVVYGKTRRINTRIVTVYPKATLRYIYDDAQNRVSVLSKLDAGNSSARDVRIDNIFDGFYRLVQKRKYNNASQFDKDTIEYNYLDLKSSQTDFKNNETKLSYNQFSRVSKTENADASHSLLEEVFLDGFSSSNGINYAFGSVSGPINKQTFTDETGRKIEKYSDVKGNLRREVRFVESEIPQQEAPPPTPLITDYKYDSLYRVISVKTPGSKYINYAYDGYGNVKSRTTADAGTSHYGYDRNGNMTFSRDAKQVSQGSNVYSFRTFDGLNRMKGLGVTPPAGPQPQWDSLNLETEYDGAGDNPSNPFANYLIINVYDTLKSSDYSFITAPSGYDSLLNNTRGRLVVTAYRTLTSDPWNFKWYRYDARGRVIKMWNVIDGFDTKVVEYNSNSGDQVVHTSYQTGETDFKLFRNQFDDAGRLANVDFWNLSGPPNENDTIDGPSFWTNLVSFAYNENSQIQDYLINTGNPITYTYSYNERNWITQFQETQEQKFSYYLEYEPNGNISEQTLDGYYNNLFGNTSTLVFTYAYDLANRLKSADNINNKEYDLTTSYDADGNITSLLRYDGNQSVVDDFTYAYNYGTNKLLRVTGADTMFTYDANGNMISDDLNDNESIEYDHRNLITKITRVVGEESITPTHQVTLYKYDDAGNRIRKALLQYTGFPPEEIGGDIDNPPTGWTYLRNEFYMRGVDGSVIAEYNSYDLERHNLYAGTDNFGRINASDGSINFYVKDHLGSTRIVLDMDNQVISAQDYDAWGYLLPDRQYESTLSDNKFTGKERDNESNYDYFGARYYDARIGRWGQVEPLLDKFPNFTPYCYSFNNLLSLHDPNGEENIIVVGGVDVTQNDAYKFVNSGIMAALDLASQSAEKTTVALMNVYLEDNEIESLKKQLGDKVSLKILNSSGELINYINSGDPFISQSSDARTNDLITDLVVFGHGVPGSIEFGYDGQPNSINKEIKDLFRIGKDNIYDIKSEAFAKDSKVTLYTCNSASEKDVNVAKTLSIITKGTVDGYNGLVSYHNIYQGQSLLNKIMMKLSGGIIKAENYPKAFKNATEESYKNGW